MPAEFRTCAAFCVSLLVFISPALGESYQWLQYTPDGLEARFITDDGKCPSAEIDAVQKAMILRADAEGAYPIRVCVLQIPETARNAAINGVPLAVPPAEPTRIAVIGTPAAG